VFLLVFVEHVFLQKFGYVECYPSDLEILEKRLLQVFIKITAKNNKHSETVIETLSFDKIK